MTSLLHKVELACMQLHLFRYDDVNGDDGMLILKYR